MAYRNKTYICFDGDEDMTYYRLMTAWKANDNHDFNFHNAHDINAARDSSSEESIKRQLRERFANSRLLIVLIGEKTKYLTKFVKWEMDVALRLNLPIIGVNLDKSKRQTNHCPSTIKSELVMYVPFGQKIIQYAMDNWPESDARHRKAGESGAYHYLDSVYESLGA